MTHRYKKKLPHQQTPEQFYESEVGAVHTDSMGRFERWGDYPHHRRLSGYAHRAHVVRALEEGEHVPAHILAKYPGITREVRAASDKVEALREMRPGETVFLVRFNDAKEPVEFRKFDADGRRVLVRVGGKNKRFPVRMIALETS